jgi:hypothetical protein
MTTNSNYLQKLLSTIDLNVEMRDRLVFRNDKLKEMFKQDDKYSDYELNEFRITMIKTENEIDVMNKVIKEKTEYFQNYAKEYENDLQEMNLNYKKVLQKAEDLRKKIKAIDHALSTVKWDMIENNEENKVFFYKRLRDLIAKG